MIKNIQVNNFKGVTNLNIEDFKRINLFVGENNSCKTTILKALRLLLCAGSSRQILDLFNLGHRFDGFDENHWKSYFYNLKTNENIEIIGNRDKNKQLTLKITPHSNVELIVKDEQKLLFVESLAEETSTINGLDFNYYVKSNNEVFEVINKLYNEEDKRDAEISYRIRPRLRGFVNNNGEYKEDKNSIYISANENLEQLSSTLYEKIYKKKQQIEIIDVLKHIEPRLVDIVPITDSLYCDMGKSFKEFLPLNTMGDGMMKLFAILVIFYSYKNGIVFIDEIENGFHYKTLDILWEVVLKAAKDFKIQLFATTHSRECVTAVSGAHEKQPKSVDDIRLYRLEKIKNSIEIIKFNSERLSSVLKEGWEIR